MSSAKLWHEAGAPRIWRAPDGDFRGDEVIQASHVYTDARIASIAAAGFTGFWLRGKLRQLMQSTVFPELNVADAEARREALRSTIARAAAHGLKVWLFFNEPLAIAHDDPFWKSHSQVRGERHVDYGATEPVDSLCTSTPEVQAFLRQAAAELLSGPGVGLGGVLLITASECHTHCWSNYARIALQDGIAEDTAAPLQCPRCRGREPAEIVGELVSAWQDAAHACATPPRVLAWNWSWSMWYPEPQREVIDALPDGIELLADFERGTHAKRRGRTLPIDEYALSVVGPSERFLGTCAAGGERGLPVNAKLQLGTTHEIATVPNLPLITNLHGKLVGLSEHGVAGFMGCWNFGCTLSLNTAAVQLFLEDPARFRDRDVFLHDLAYRYFALSDSAQVIAAWEGFAAAFEHYPFAIRLLYFSPVNYAVAYPLSPRYEGSKLGGSWLIEARGDRLDDSLPTGMTSGEVAAAFGAAADRWGQAMNHYAEVLSPEVDGEAGRHRREELACARMIGLQLCSASHIYAFHAWRTARIRDLALTAPCEVPLDDDARMLLAAERATCMEALPLAEADPRLGFHQECQAYQFTPAAIRDKLEQLERLLS